MIREIIVFAYQPTDLQDFAVTLVATAVLVAALYFVVTEQFTRSYVLVVSRFWRFFCSVRRRQLAPFFTTSGDDIKSFSGSCLLSLV